MGSHWQHWTMKSWLCPLAFFKGMGVHLPDHPPPPPPWMGHFWASYSLLVWYGIPVHVAVKLICLTIGLWIFLSKDNVLLLLQYDTGGVNWQCEPSAFGVCIFIYLHWYFLIFSYWTVNRSLCALTVLTGGGGPSAIGVSIFIYALVFPYIFLLNSEEITLFSGSVEWGGPFAFGVCIFIYALVFPYIFLLNSEEITLFSGSVDWGVHLHVFSMHWYFLIFSY